MKKYLPKGLFARTFLIVVVPVLLLQLAVSIVFFERHWSKMTARLATAVSGEIAAIVDLMEHNPDNTKIVTVQQISQKHLSLFFDYRPDVHEFPVRTGDPSLNIASDLISELGRVISYPYIVTGHRNDKRFIVDILMNDKLLTVIVPEGRIYSASSYIFILWMIGLSLVFFSVALLFMRNQIRPIYRLGLIAERMGRGIPVARFKPTGAREVRQAGEAFIQMQDRIQSYVQQRTTMLAGVSHDLRTPLTRMKLQLAMMGDSPDVEAMQKDISDMEKMIEGYLSFAKGVDDEAMQKTSLTRFMEQVAEDARRLNIALETDFQGIEGEDFWCKPEALKRCFNNFISNAARHGTAVKITTRTDDEHITILFEDNGPGIPKEMRADVMKPFFRGESSRNQKTGGVGLGLTIATDIITSHAGHMHLGTSKDLGGLKVTVTLPF